MYNMKGTYIMGKVNKSTNFKNFLKDKIDDGTYQFGTPIPSERILSEDFDLSRSTVREAIKQLIKEEYLIKSQGKGTYVIKNLNASLRINFKGMTELLTDAGFHPSTKIIVSEKKCAGYKLSKIFNVDPSENLFRIIRLRRGNTQAISIEDTYVPCRLIPNIEEIDFQIFSLYDMLAHNGVQIHNINHVISTTKARNNEAKLLNLQDGEGVVSINLSAFSQTLGIVEHTRVLAVSGFSSFYTDCFIENGEVKVYAQGD